MLYGKVDKMLRRLKKISRPEHSNEETNDLICDIQVANPTVIDADHLVSKIPIIGHASIRTYSFAYR